MGIVTDIKLEPRYKVTENLQPVESLSSKAGSVAKVTIALLVSKSVEVNTASSMKPISKIHIKSRHSRN